MILTYHCVQCRKPRVFEHATCTVCDRPDPDVPYHCPDCGDARPTYGAPPCQVCADRERNPEW